MDTHTSNIYLFKALDAYPYELEETIEALNYALSYDDKNVIALCLMANLHANSLNDYKTAKYYFEAAVASDMEMPNIYPDYIFTLLANEDFEEAQKLIEFARTLKATDKAVIELLQGYVYESTTRYKQAIKVFKLAKEKAKNNSFSSFVDEQLERVKNKLPKKKNKKRKKKNKKNKRKEKKENRSKK